MKGFSAHLVVFIVVALFGFGLFFFAFNSDFSDVKGISEEGSFSNGALVSLTSRESSWDMFQYLCSDIEECKESIDSGKRVSKLSGDVVELKEIKLAPLPSWEDTDYLKVYVRPSWDVLSAGFKVISKGDVPGTEVLEIPYGQSKQEVVVIPISEITEYFYKSATFSD